MEGQGERRKEREREGGTKEYRRGLPQNYTLSFFKNCQTVTECASLFHILTNHPIMHKDFNFSTSPSIPVAVHIFIIVT